MSVKMSKLPNEVKTLVNQGIYSLYSVSKAKNSAVHFALVTNDRRAYLLSVDGEVISSLADLSSVEIDQPILFPDVLSFSLPKLNCV